MIQSFADEETESFFIEDVCQPQWRQFESVAKRKLDAVDSAHALGDLRFPGGNRLGKKSGDLDGVWSIRINDQWRVTFRWGSNGPEDVKITDYH